MRADTASPVHIVSKKRDLPKEECSSYFDEKLPALAGWCEANEDEYIASRTRIRLWILSSIYS